MRDLSSCVPVPRFDRPEWRRVGGLLLGMGLVAGAWLGAVAAVAGPIRAGVAKVEITDRQAGPVNDPLYVKALVLADRATTVAIVTVDAVAIGEIGRIKNSYLGEVRQQIQQDLNIRPANVLVAASHCHGVVCSDVASRTIQAVREAAGNLVPVRVGAGLGREERIMENRRLMLKDGRVADVRHAYSLPPDEAVAGIGPVDPGIGLLRLDREDGHTLAVVYNFACHPIQGVPSGANTADLVGFASKVLEEALGPGTMALFLQGCAGDINPVQYKDVHNPRDAEPLGNMLGLSALQAVKAIQTRRDATLGIVNEVLTLPRATDTAQRIAAAEAEQARLLGSLRGTTLNLKNFVPLFVQYQVSGEYPAYDSHRYLRDEAIGREDLVELDATNRANLEQYIHNIHVMEELTRLQANVRLLKKHQAQNAAAGSPTLDVEVVGLRVGDFRLVTFPGELSVEIGLGIKQRAPKPLTFVASCTNGYIYYAPTERQRKNTGFAQEDCDCLVSPQWQKVFEEKVASILARIE